MPRILPLRIVFAAAVALLAAAAPAQDRDDPLDTVADLPAQARLTLIKAAEARGDGGADEAAALLRELLDDRPQLDHFLVRFHLGSSLELAGRVDEAVPQYRAAVALEPRHAESWLGLGRSAYAVERYAESGEALEQGFRRGVDVGAEVLYYAGASYLLADDPAAAARVLEDLTSGRHGEPPLDWFRARLSACVELGDARRGRAAVADMLAVHPDVPEAWSLAYGQAAASDDLERAATYLTVKSYLAPLGEAELVLLGDLYRVIDAPIRAVDYYAAALGEAPAPEDFERLAAAYLAAHERGEAERVLNEALAAAPSVRLWALLGDLKAMAEDYAGAYEAFRACADLDAGYGRAWLMMGYCALESERFDDARSKLRRAQEFEDQRESAGTLLRRAESLARREDLEP